MSLKDVAKTVGKAAVKGTLGYLEQSSHDVAYHHRKEFSDEQMEGLGEFEDRMHDWKNKVDEWD